MVEKILSIREIDEIEKAYGHGVGSLGFAAEKLLERWQFGLRDAETLIRLVFLFWYSRTEPSFLTGLTNQFEGFSVEGFIGEPGGELNLDSEGRFVIGILGHSTYAFGLGDEEKWQRIARDFLGDAASMETTSFLFAEWKFLIGEVDDTQNLRTKIEREVHARFAGRGYMGDYMIHTLSGLIRPHD